MPEGIRAVLLLLALSLAAVFTQPVVAVDKLTVLKVGSKRFTESYILGELVAQQARSAGEAEALHQRGLGNTGIVLNALKTGDIDVYAEYTGTIAKEILKLDAVPSLAELNRLLAPMKLAVAVPLGFNNTYALAMRSEDAQKRHIARISDLAAAGALRFGLSQEFIGRADGWSGLQQHYRLSFATPRGLDHGLAYQALAQNEVDLIDVYSTDAMLEKYPLTVLQDDRQYFPRYDAVLLYRSDLPQRFPRSWVALGKLADSIDDAAMRRMNAAAELGGKDFDIVAREFLSQRQGASSDAADVGTAQEPAARSWQHEIFAKDFWRLTVEHLALVFIALVISIVLGVPLGIIAARRPKIGAAILAATGMLQTIPSLALLAILIPVTGRIGQVPALIALALYALLPIVRNTHTGLQQITLSMKQAAQSLGLADGTILRNIELPLAAATIWAGIKTSAVISVGTATIAAFVGAGGYGERIVTGLALNDNATLLAGAIPCAVLALLIEAAFGIAERWIVPQGLRTK